ncbi:MAG: adenylosuccinate lyase [Chlamydiota bacterium]
MNPEEPHFESPLATRYASKEMLKIFSSEYRYSTWRKLWVALARAQRNLGLPIRADQVLAMEKKIHDIDFKRVAYYEKQLGHDVMAHIHAFGDVCPEAKGVIHLGATSCYITDNTDLYLMKEGLKILKGKLVDTIRHLSVQAESYADLACLSYTHLQTAQPTTVGKRMCGWLQDLLMDLQDLITAQEQLYFFGVKGATGTQASYMALFEENPDKIRQLEEMIAEEMGFTKILPISGQTYTRKQDIRIVNCLCSLAVSAHKFGTDIRLLAHMKEMEEPFGEKQIGSSAMPYKRNPNRSERMCGLARFLISLQANPIYTAATQWLERSLDDSSNRRLSLPEAFLTADSIINLYHFISSNLVVYPKIIEHHLKEEIGFLGTEHILTASFNKGQDRQVVHEALRVYSQRVAKKWKEEGIKEDLLKLIAEDPLFDLSHEELQQALHPMHFVGRAPEQVREFLKKEITPVLNRHEQVQAYNLNIQI